MSILPSHCHGAPDDLRRTNTENNFFVAREALQRPVLMPIGHKGGA